MEYLVPKMYLFVKRLKMCFTFADKKVTMKYRRKREA